jgi:CubicO group peptidase (beta-lactamase class C family)
MPKYKLIKFVAIWAMLITYVSHAQFHEPFSVPFEKSIEKSMARSQTPGLSISIVHKGKEVYAKAFGVKDLSTQEPLKTDHQFHWASVTKPIVAAAAMQLVEQGKLDLDVPIIGYLAYFTLDDPNFRTITSRQLLTHTAGMPDVDDYEWSNPQYDDGALERWVRSIDDKKLLFPPETDAQYSNIGFEVMGDVIAKCSGVSFEEFVAQNIFAPLEMNTATLLIKETEPKIVSLHIP